MSTSKSRGGSGRGAIEIQLSAHVLAPTRVVWTKDLLQQAIAHRIDTGEDPSGITLRIVRWRHGANLPWKGEDEDNEHAWKTFGRLLQFASVDVHTVRRHTGDRS